MAEHARLFIGRNEIALTVFDAAPNRTRLRSRPTIKRSLRELAADTGWPAALEACRHAVATLSAGTRLEILLGSLHVRHAMLPFDAAFADPALQQAAANALIATQYRLDGTRPQRVAVTRARWQAASFVTAIDENKVRDLDELATRYRLTVEIRPAIGLLTDAIAAATGMPAQLAILDDIRCIRIDSRNGCMTSIQTLPVEPDRPSWQQLAGASAVVMSPALKLNPAPGQAVQTAPAFALPDGSEPGIRAWTLLSAPRSREPGLEAQKPHTLTRVLLLAACVLAGVQVQRALHLQTELETLVIDDAAMVQPTGQAASRTAEAMDPALEAVRQRLLTPWESLLDALSIQAGHEIALQSVRPDVTRGTAEVSGTAVDRDAFLAYVTRLRNDQRLIDAEAIADEPLAVPTPNGGKLEFRLRVRWGGQP